MAGVGPPPKHPSQRRRRNATVPMIRLPAGGRSGKPPKWPITLAVSKLDTGKGSPGAKITTMLRRLERQLWVELWATPQAVAWEQLGYSREVAMYVRWMVRAEHGDLDAAKEARQISDRLGLSPLAMLRLRWEIADDELAQARERHEPDPRDRRRHIKALDPAAASA